MPRPEEEAVHWMRFALKMAVAIVSFSVKSGPEKRAAEGTVHGFERRKGEKMQEFRRRPYWGWYVVLGAFLVMGINYGTRYSFGVFVQPMALDHGWSRSVVSAGMSVMVLAYGIGGIFAGRLIDRIAPRWIITAGSLVMAAGLFLTGLVREPWQF
jgi:sugar phosphate permease